MTEEEKNEYWKKLAEQIVKDVQENPCKMDRKIFKDIEQLKRKKPILLIGKDKKLIKIDKIKEVQLDYESYLGGISDLIGELVRRAIKMATDGKFKEVKKIHQIADDIMAELVEFDMRSYLRTKYDQAKGHLRKIEQINYEINLRK